MGLEFKLMDILTEENDIIIYNPLSINWTKYDWTNGYYKHRVTKIEIRKPWLVSYAYYGSVVYENIIFWLNRIDDPFEMMPGTELWIPKLDDLKTFIRNNKK